VAKQSKYHFNFGFLQLKREAPTNVRRDWSVHNLRVDH